MKDIHYHSENLCSIAQIEDTFFGKFIIREILNRVLRYSFLVNASVQRPYFETQLSIKAISEISSELENLTVDEDWFSLSFSYYTKDNNDRFINTFLEIWFEYEQPAFAFFVAEQKTQTYRNLSVGKRMSWKEITALSPCYVMYRGAEEDVMWIGKSDNLEFDKVIV